MSTSLTFEINGQLVNPPVEWGDIEVSISFDEESVQANITIESFTFVNEVNKLIKDRIEAGKLNGVGIFEGPEFKITAIDENQFLSVFEGHLDLTDQLEIINPVKLRCKIAKDKGLNSLNDTMQANSFAFLEAEKGVFSNSDYFNVDYVVEREETFIERAVLAIATYDMVKEIQFAIKEISDQGAKSTASGVPVPSAPVPAPNLSMIILSIMSAIIQLIYFALMIIAVKNLIVTLLNTLISPVRTYKGIKVKTALEKAINYLGYGFNTGISELDNLVYLPSRATEQDNITKGIPKSNEEAYMVSGMVNMVNKIFSSKIAIMGNNVELRAENDPFWQLNSTYTMPDVLIEDYRYNTQDLVANRVFSFRTDPLNEWTTRNWKGTNYEVITHPIIVNNKNRVKIKGLESVDFGVALGSRKDGLNLVENILKTLAGFADSVINLFGGNSNLKNDIKKRVGMLKLSKNTHSMPMLLYYENGSIPKNHRDLFSAKSLYNKYHIHNSFVANNYNGQKLLYKTDKIPFTFNDFLKVIDNSFFTTFNGKQAKFINLSWAIDKDRASVEYWVREVYTKNLKENGIEPE